MKWLILLLLMSVCSGILVLSLHKDFTKAQAYKELERVMPIGDVK